MAGHVPRVEHKARNGSVGRPSFQQSGTPHTNTRMPFPCSFIFQLFGLSSSCHRPCLLYSRHILWRIAAYAYVYRNKQMETQYNTYAMELLVTQAQFYEQITTELVTQSLQVQTSGMTLSMREAADFFSTWILKSVDPNMVFLRCLKYRHLLFLSDKTKRLF